jgi:putative aldouronate transport system permease protein
MQSNKIFMQSNEDLRGLDQSDLSTKKFMLYTVLAVFFAGLCVASMMLPWVHADFASGRFALGGFDVAFGRYIPGDPFGAVPQQGALFSVLLLAAAIAVRLLHRSKIKATFLACLCSIGAFISLLLASGSDEIQARFDPIISGFTYGLTQSGYYVSVASFALFLAFNVYLVLSNRELRADLIYNRYLYIMAIPVFVFVIVFFYMPIYGIYIAFTDFSPRLGILGSPFVGVENFMALFQSPFFRRIVVNTLALSLLDIAFGFTIPIVLALFINELRSHSYKRIVQTCTYLPFFISLVVVAGMIRDFTTRDGLINTILILFGMPEENARNFLMDPGSFRTIFTASAVWQSAGWNSIVYLAALTAIDSTLYEAARVDGAKRWRMMWHITMPGLMPTIITLFILRLGALMSVGFERVILLYNDNTLVTADVIASFVYRRGLVQGDFSFAAATGLFNSIINLGLVIAANTFSRRVSDTSLW